MAQRGCRGGALASAVDYGPVVPKGVCNPIEMVSARGHFYRGRGSHGIDRSNPEQPVGWVVEHKMSDGAAHAGTQLENAGAIARALGLDQYEAVTGSTSELLEVLSRGRGDW